MTRNQTPIDGVKIVEKRIIRDQRGAIYHMLRSDDPEFSKFGEIYFSEVRNGIVKGWHFHTLMSLNYLLISGEILLVLFDDREDSPTRGSYNEIQLKEADQNKLVQIPPLVWNGFKGVAEPRSIVANCSDIPHDPDEILRKPIDDPIFNYDWQVDKNLPHG